MSTKRLFAHISLVILMFALASVGLSKEKSVESKWTSQPPMIDGLYDDWSEDALTSEGKVKVDYAVRNDDQNIYVLFIFKDPKYLSTIQATGIILYFDTEVKKKKDHGLHFLREELTPEELIAYLEGRGETLTEERKQAIRAKPGYVVHRVETVGKKEQETPETSQMSSTLKPDFKINIMGKEVIYEFRIPLAKSEVSPQGIGVEPGQTIKVGFEWGGMTEALLKRMGGRAESGRGTDTEDSVRRVSSRRNELTTRQPRMPKKYSFWVDVKLAQNQ